MGMVCSKVIDLDKDMTSSADLGYACRNSLVSLFCEKITEQTIIMIIKILIIDLILRHFPLFVLGHSLLPYYSDLLHFRILVLK